MPAVIAVTKMIAQGAGRKIPAPDDIEAFFDIATNTVSYIVRSETDIAIAAGQHSCKDIAACGKIRCCLLAPAGERFSGIRIDQPRT